MRSSLTPGRRIRGNGDQKRPRVAVGSAVRTNSGQSAHDETVRTADPTNCRPVVRSRLTPRRRIRGKGDRKRPRVALVRVERDRYLNHERLRHSDHRRRHRGIGNRQGVVGAPWEVFGGAGSRGSARGPPERSQQRCNSLGAVLPCGIAQGAPLRPRAIGDVSFLRRTRRAGSAMRQADRRHASARAGAVG